MRIYDLITLASANGWRVEAHAHQVELVSEELSERFIVGNPTGRIDAEIQFPVRVQFIGEYEGDPDFKIPTEKWLREDLTGRHVIR